MTSRIRFQTLCRPILASLLAASAACHPPSGTADAALPADPAAAPHADAAPVDAAMVDAGARTFPCWRGACLRDGEYCYQVFSGVRSPGAERRSPVERDADGGATVGCNSLPAACMGTPMCGCIVADIKTCPSLLLRCEEMAGGFYVACLLP